MTATEYRELPLSDLRAGTNVRDANRDIAGLAASIAEVGIIEPLVVTANGTGYIILDGHRRYAAAKKAKLATVPCVVRATPETDASRITLQLVANLQRDGLTEREEAVAFEQLHLAGLTPAQIAKATGRKAAHVSDRVSLFVLPEPTHDRVWEGQIPIEHAITLAGIKDAERRDWLEKFTGSTSFAWKATDASWRDEQKRRAEKARQREERRKAQQDYRAAVAAAKAAGEPIPEKPTKPEPSNRASDSDWKARHPRTEALGKAATIAAEVRVPWVTARLVELAGQTVVLPGPLAAMARATVHNSWQAAEYRNAIAPHATALTDAQALVIVLACDLGLLEDYDYGYSWWDKDSSGPRLVRWLVEHLDYQPTPEEAELASGNYAKPKPARKTPAKKKTAAAPDDDTTT